ncbi:unnamed protein product [Didymodactylos carnosus]|nr:unnamed protein product [Didymodactylos carnosus]CAF4364994.1 unnamed protein product [Didymodactylos carnosus]
MSGSVCEAMAQAVEKSKFILMCMSETYKQSVACKNEALYAWDRKKTIIPLKMKTVDLDDWLGFVAAGKLYIDFSNQDFDKALKLLTNEIEKHHSKQQRKQEPVNIDKLPRASAAQTNAIPSGAHITSAVPTAIPAATATRKMRDRPDVISDAYKQIPIESWSEQQVIDFLFDKKLDLMTLICQEMNGEVLYYLYKKCQQSDPWPMFDRLNIEMDKIHQQILPISVYLRFLNEIQNFLKATLL